MSIVRRNQNDKPANVRRAKVPEGGLHAIMRNQLVLVLGRTGASALQLRMLVCLLALAQRQGSRSVTFDTKYKLLRYLGSAVTTTKYYDTLLDMVRFWETVELELNWYETGNHTPTRLRVLKVKPEGDGFVVCFDTMSYQLNQETAQGLWRKHYVAYINRFSKPQPVLLCMFLTAMPIIHRWGRATFAEKLGVQDPDMWKFMGRLKGWVELVNSVLGKNFKVTFKDKNVRVSEVRTKEEKMEEKREAQETRKARQEPKAEEKTKSKKRRRLTREVVAGRARTPPPAVWEDDDDVKTVDADEYDREHGSQRPVYDYE